jgi:hypothetical protein
VPTNTHVCRVSGEPASPRLLSATTDSPEPRHHHLAANRPLEDWGKLIGDVPSATVIQHRFLHHAEIIAIIGRSYRTKDRAKPKAPPNPRPGKQPSEQDTCQEQPK